MFFIHQFDLDVQLINKELQCFPSQSLFFLWISHNDRVILQDLQFGLPLQIRRTQVQQINCREVLIDQFFLLLPGIRVQILMIQLALFQPLQLDHLVHIHRVAHICEVHHELPIILSDGHFVASHESQRVCILDFQTSRVLLGLGQFRIY